MPHAVKRLVKSVSNVHRPDGRANVLLFSTPRSGSTWLMELIWTQPGFKYCNQPLSLINAQVRLELGLNGWGELYDERSVPTLERYFDDICAGRLRFANPSPLRGHYRPVTHRIVFKEIHGLADRIDWFSDRFDARVAFLVRHPIAVAISAERFPLLGTFLTTAYRNHFTSEQITFANRVAADGSHVERGVLSWCLQNAVPLRDMSDDWALVTYEQLVIEPEPVIGELADKLELPEPDRIAEALTVPSVNVKIKSTDETRQLLYEGTRDRRPHLIEKWRQRVDEAEERRAMRALDVFGLDVYRAGDVFPAPWAWLPRPAPHREPLREAGG
jgi:Sulfotransferase domain